MALTDLQVSTEALEALHQAKPMGRPGLMMYEGLDQEVDPLLEQFSSESARNFLFGMNVLHLGFSSGESGAVRTAHIATGDVTEWDVIFRREREVGVPMIRVERLSIRPKGNRGRQGKAEIKIPIASDQVSLIMLSGSNFVPMAPIQPEEIPEIFSTTPRHEPQLPRPELVR